MGRPWNGRPSLQRRLSSEGFVITLEHEGNQVSIHGSSWSLGSPEPTSWAKNDMWQHVEEWVLLLDQSPCFLGSRGSDLAWSEILPLPERLALGSSQGEGRGGGGAGLATTEPEKLVPYQMAHRELSDSHQPGCPPVNELRRNHCLSGHSPLLIPPAQSRSEGHLEVILSCDHSLDPTFPFLDELDELVSRHLAYLQNPRPQRPSVPAIRCRVAPLPNTPAAASQCVPASPQGEPGRFHEDGMVPVS